MGSSQGHGEDCLHRLGEGGGDEHAPVTAAKIPEGMRYRPRLSRLRRHTNRQSSQRCSKENAIEMVSHHVSGNTMDFIKAQTMLAGHAATGHIYSEQYVCPDFVPCKPEMLQDVTG